MRLWIPATLLSTVVIIGASACHRTHDGEPLPDAADGCTTITEVDLGDGECERFTLVGDEQTMQCRSTRRPFSPGWVVFRARTDEAPTAPFRVYYRTNVGWDDACPDMDCTFDVAAHEPRSCPCRVGTSGPWSSLDLRPCAEGEDVAPSDCRVSSRDGEPLGMRVLAGTTITAFVCPYDVEPW